MCLNQDFNDNIYSKAKYIILFDSRAIDEDFYPLSFAYIILIIYIIDILINIFTGQSEILIYWINQ